MDSLTSISFFNSEGSSLSSEQKLAGFVVGIALLASGVFMRCCAQSLIRTVRDFRAAFETASRRAAHAFDSAVVDPIIIRDDPRMFEYVATSNKLTLEYRGGSPAEANQEMRKAMANAINIFLNHNRRLKSQPEPGTLEYKEKLSVSNYAEVPSSDSSSNAHKRVIHCINPGLMNYKLEIDVRGSMEDKQWKFIEEQLLKWKKTFPVSEDLFSN